MKKLIDFAEAGTGAGLYLDPDQVDVVSPNSDGSYTLIVVRGHPVYVNDSVRDVIETIREYYR